MLQITIPGGESFDEASGRFVRVRGQTIQLEHSLVSLSKWESKWKVPFLNKTDMTPEQSLDYVRCMNITQNVDPNAFRFLSQENMQEIKKYIDDPMTATWFRNRPGRPPNREVVTSEIIYFWMITLGIPLDPCQKWHLNRLMTLIRVCDEKNRPSKKMSKSQSAKQYSALNAARRARSGSRG